MTVREYLKQAFILQKLINTKKSRIQDLRDMQFSVRTSVPGVRVQSSPKLDPVGDLAVVLIDLIDECQKDIYRLLEIQREIEALINSVERLDYRLILYERYVNLKHWEDIAVDNNYSIQHVWRLHGKAIQKICCSIEKYKEERECE